MVHRTQSSHVDSFEEFLNPRVNKDAIVEFFDDCFDAAISSKSIKQRQSDIDYGLALCFNESGNFLIGLRVYDEFSKGLKEIFLVRIELEIINFQVLMRFFHELAGVNSGSSCRKH